MNIFKKILFTILVIIIINNKKFCYFFFCTRLQQLTMELNIERFNLKNVTKDGVYLFIGKRGSGKTNLLHYVLNQLKPLYKYFVLISGTEIYTGDFCNKLPESFIYDFEHASLGLERVLKAHKKRAKKNKNKPPHKRKPMKKTLIIAEDMSTDGSFLRNRYLREILMNGRHIGICLMLTTQYMMDVVKSTRVQYDYVFCLRMNAVDLIKNVHNNFGGIIYEFRNFLKIYYQLTHNNSALVIDNRTTSSKINKVIFWFKVPKDSDKLQFLLGSKSYWKYHYANTKNLRQHSSSSSSSHKKKKKKTNNNNNYQYYDDDDEEDTEQDAEKNGKSNPVVIKKIRKITSS